MNTRRCHRIALRIDALLLTELGQGIEPQRMLTQPLYARDVLLVCDAHTGGDLAALAQHFRAAVADTSPENSGNVSGNLSSNSSQPSGRESTAPGGLPGALVARPAQPAGWFSRARWLGK